MLRPTTKLDIAISETANLIGFLALVALWIGALALLNGGK